MTQFFAKDYTGGAFVLFGAAHLIGLAAVVAVCLAIAFLRRCFTPRAQAITRWTLLVLIISCESSWHI